MGLEPEIKLNEDELKIIENTVRMIRKLNRDNQIRSEAFIAGLTAAQGNRSDQPVVVG